MSKPTVLAQVTDETWAIPRSIETYKALYNQATVACAKQGMQPMDALLIAATVLTSIGIHVNSALDKVPHE